MRYLWLTMLLLPVILLGNAVNYNYSNTAIKFDRATAQFDRPAAANWVYTTAPGSYRLPVQTINLILPSNAENVVPTYTVKGISYLPAEKPELNTAYSDGNRFLTSNPALQPAQHVVFQGTGKWGDVSYARFAVYPYLYNAALKAYETASDVTLSVSYNLSGNKESTNNKIPKLLKTDPSFVNKEVLTNWYPERELRTYDYLIVSTISLYNAAEELVNFRQNQGLVTAFADMNMIIATTPGATAADKLRNYLTAEYIDSPFSYLLLIGDIDLVPTAMLTPEPDGLDTVPSDFYFSDLSSNFDSDNDGRLGEYNTGMDYTPELYVGRIPWNNATLVSSICNRIVSYETNTADWKNKVLLPAAILNYYDEDGNGDYERTDGATWVEYCKSTALRNRLNTTLYEQAGIQPSINSDFPLTQENFSMLLENQNWGIINWSAHGSPVSSARKVWEEDTDNDNQPDGMELQWYGLVDTDLIEGLTNQTGSVFFCASCLNGTVDGNYPSLGEVLLRDKAVADIAATRTGWYKLGWANPGWGGLSSYNYHFLENYADQGMTVGQAHALANWMHTQYCLFGDPVDSNGIIWPELQNIYTYMLFGDPAVGYPSQVASTQGNILVWEPVGNTGTTLVNGLQDIAPFNLVYTDHLIDTYNYLDQFDAVFCLFGLGYGQNNYYLPSTSFEYQYLLTYLQQGGKVYMEGMVSWNPDDPLFGRFGTIAPFDHIAFVDSIRYGAFPDFDLWDYTGYNGGTQALTTSGTIAQPLFWSYNMQTVSDIIGVWNRAGESRTIASSFNLGGVTALELPYTQFLSIILDTLDVWHLAPVANDDDTITPAAMTLQAYPNPFTNRLQIFLKNTSDLNLSIFNIKGQLIKSVFLNAKNDAVSYNWDGTDKTGKSVPAGIYLIRTKDGNHAQALKALKLR